VDVMAIYSLLFALSFPLKRALSLAKNGSYLSPPALRLLASKHIELSPPLMATYERILERLPKTLERLSRKGASGVLIIVEGRKDATALRRLGIKGKMFTIKNSGKILEDSLDEAFGPEVVILVDFDEHGTELAKEIANYLESRRIKADLSIWRDVRALVRRDIKDVEGLPSYLERLKKRVLG